MNDVSVQLITNDTITYHKGHIHSQEDRTEIKYEMQIDERMTPVIFSIEKDRILLTQESYTLTFVEGEKHAFLCKTPYGEVSLSVKCREMWQGENEVKIIYEIYDGDHFIEERKIELKYEKENQSERNP